MTAETTDILERVERSLDTMRPYLNDDGGNVEVVDITDEMIVRVKLIGACSTCPQSFMTMKAGIEEAVKRAVPEVKGVMAINLTKHPEM
ncbi:MAG TPA: NifU family protein [Chitinophagales bacterium]|nr:NifU family protein [Chitinophagales bacterium]